MTVGSLFGCCLVLGAVLAGDLPCETCGGKGTMVVQEPDFGQTTGSIGNQRKKKTISCPICGGKGRIESYRDPTVLQMEMVAEREKNAAERGDPCPTCSWTGIVPCKKCRGAGFVNCPEKDCKGGWIVTKTTKTTKSTKSSGGFRGCGRSSSTSRSGSRTSSRTETKITVTPCPVCQGVGKARCPECGGRRATPCRKCGGLGTAKKRARGGKAR